MQYRRGYVEETEYIHEMDHQNMASLGGFLRCRKALSTLLIAIGSWKSGVVEPQMPKGVEHRKQIRYLVELACGRTSDAERR